MPKILLKEDEKAEFKGEPVDIRAWLSKPRMVKTDKTNEKGEPVFEPATDGNLYENVSNAVAEELKSATEVLARDIDKDSVTPDRVVALKTDNLVAQILTAQTRVKADKDEKEGKLYSTEYVNLGARTVAGSLIIMDGIADTEQYASDKDKAEGNELPSVAKYFNQGYGILARNAAAARIRTLVEGPDKALEAAARDLARAKGWSIEKARAKVALMAADD